MAGLGLILTWSGYLLLAWGVSKVKAGSGGTPLSLSDCALPSHRAAYIAAMTQVGSIPGQAALNAQNQTIVNQAGGAAAIKAGTNATVYSLPGGGTTTNRAQALAADDGTGTK